ncbi:MAG: SufD family Fe-S cluster assembly protein [Nanoarchaeota archaeon]|nr:SufD family Fe-S cluster assembly protein [Nanoarchaeota archaeon]
MTTTLPPGITKAATYPLARPLLPKIGTEYCLCVAPQTVVPQPILLPDADHVVLDVGAGSAVSFLERPSRNTTALEVRAQHGSRVHITTLQTLPLTASSHATKRAVVEQDAAVRWLDCQIGAKTATVDQQTVLAEHGASMRSIAVFAGRQDQVHHSTLTARHDAPHTTSTLRLRGVLHDRAQARAHGLIRIQPAAIQAQGFQQADILLLSPDAVAEPTPILEINQNDVRCSHKATVGQLDKDTIFYMMTRGLPRAVAEQRYIEGFLLAVLSPLPPALRDPVTTLVKETMRGAYEPSI